MAISSGSITLVDVNDSKQLQLYISSTQPKTQIYDPNNGSYTPNWTNSKPVLTPQLFVAGTSSDIISQAKSIKWYIDGEELTANTDDYTMATGKTSLTINSNVLSSTNSKLFVCEVTYTDPDTGFDVIAKADIEFSKVSAGLKGANGSNGADAIVAVLSNDSQVIPTDSSGNHGNFTGATSTLTIYEGTRDITSSYSISQSTSNVTVTASGTPANRIATVTAMSADYGSVTFTATRSGYPTVTKVFNLSKSKQGYSGANATSYWLVSSAAAIKKDVSGTFTPQSLTISGMSQTGTSSPVSYSTYYKVYESTDGTNFTVKYTSTSNAASLKYPSSGSLSGSLKAIKIEMYKAGGTSVLLDTQIIPVVSDGLNGRNGADSIRAVVWTPNGNIIKNSSGTLTAKCDVYKGSTILTSGVSYKWYIQDPDATTTSGGDNDGGNGWRLLNSTTNYGTTGYTSNILTIPAGAISSLESFKCVATYSNIKYSDVCTVSDVTDPIMVTIVGGNMFKNGQGSVTLTAKLYRNGYEIDSDGTTYTYAWSLYDMSMVKNTSWSKTGKTITVNSSDISGKGNVVCEVNK